MKSFFIYVLIFLISCTVYTSKTQQSNEKCFNYGPEKVQLEGQLYRKSFPGPPNYTDINKGDEEEIYWLIKATKSFCVNEGVDTWEGKLINQSEVQLVMNPELDFYKTKRYLLGHTVSVQGTLFPQHTGHHKTDVLITVESLEKANE